jgi:hypothetical protein
MNGTVNPNALDTTWYDQYGETASYGHQTPVQDVGSGTANVPVSATIEILSFNFHYRVVAVNAVGTTDGADQITAPYTIPPPCPPPAPLFQITTGRATGVHLAPGACAHGNGARYTATLHGTISPTPAGVGTTVTAWFTHNGDRSVSVQLRLRTRRPHRLAITVHGLHAGTVDFALDASTWAGSLWTAAPRTLRLPACAPGR